MIAIFMGWPYWVRLCLVAIGCGLVVGVPARILDEFLCWRRYMRRLAAENAACRAADEGEKL